MKSPTSLTARERLAQQAGALFSVVWLHVKQLCRAIRHQRGIATLADQDDYLLADIGLTRNDVRHAMAEPFWRDPSETLWRRAAATRRLPLMRGLRPSADAQCRRALAELTDEAHGLSEHGRRLRNEVRPLEASMA